MGNHLHLIVEAEDEVRLSRGMQGLAIRMARGLNRVLKRTGPVFSDRYHRRDLKTPREVRNGLAYVLQNYRKHANEQGVRCPRGWVDGRSSAPWFDGWSGQRRAAPQGRDNAPVVPATVWLLTVGWRKHFPLISRDEIPGAKRYASIRRC